MWWAAVTVATVGYGDQVPRTRGGRVFAISWMLFGLVAVGFLSGSISSTLTVNRLQSDIQGPQDLLGKRVATEANTTSHAYLERNGINVVSVARLDDAFDLLESETVDAIV